MSGHSKWANIKIKKGKTDALRGKIFTKIGREIAIAVREGGSNPDSNSKLRDVIAKAKSNNMPNDNIQRSIKKAAGELGNVDYEEITYEAMPPAGVAVIVETYRRRNRDRQRCASLLCEKWWLSGRNGQRELHVRQKGRSGDRAHSGFR